MKVSIFGAGYVGLVTAACFAEVGNNVVCLDVNESRIDELKKGIVPIKEDGLDELIADNLRSGHLQFTADTKRAVEHGEILFIAVGTPSDEDGSADLSHVLSAAKAIGATMSEPKVIVNKSTVPVGSGARVASMIAEVLEQRGVDLDFDVVSNPEFLKEGVAVSDFMKPDRIIVGSSNPKSAGLLEDLYRPFNRNRDRVLHMDVPSAELTKYAANVMLAAKISLMNEFANLAELVGADIESVRAGMGSDPRIGYHFIYPGVGYGGSCFPKDVRALNHIAKVHGYSANMIPGIERTNDEQKQLMFKKLGYYFGSLKHRTIALWGLAFKPNTDDMREAPSVALIKALVGVGATVRCYDPVAGAEARRLLDGLNGVEVVDSAREATVSADALVVLTEWNEFRSLDYAMLKENLSHTVIFDGRNIYNPSDLRREGFDYFGVGRSTPRPAIAAKPSSVPGVRGFGESPR